MVEKGEGGERDDWGKVKDRREVVEGRKRGTLLG